MDSEVEAILGAYLGLNDWLKALWLVTPALTLVAVIGLMLHHRRARTMPAGQTLYSISRIEDGEMRVFRNQPQLTPIAGKYPPLVPLPREARASGAPQRSVPPSLV